MYNATAAPANVTVKFNNGVFTMGDTTHTTTGTAAGKKSTVEDAATSASIGADKITITANKYGKDNDVTIKVKFDAFLGSPTLKISQTTKSFLGSPALKISQIMRSFLGLKIWKSLWSMTSRLFFRILKTATSALMNDIKTVSLS